MASDVRCKADLDGMGCVGDLGWYCIGFTLFVFNYDLPSSVTGHPGATVTCRDTETHLTI